MNESFPTTDELEALEQVVVAALESRDDSTLNVLGYGEVSVALGWPIEEPTFVCKRTPPFTRTQFAEYQGLIEEYVAGVQASGLAVVDTKVVPISRGDDVISYLVQPKLASTSLGDNVLQSAEPDPEHPFLEALAGALDVVSPTLSIDAQVTNFSWDGSRLTLIDVGTPFMWDETGELRFEMKPFARMLPAPTRLLATRELTKLVTRWNDPRRVAVDVVANLYRANLPEWVDATVTAMNGALGRDSISAKEARELFEEDLKIWPFLKKLQAAERWWQTTVRRQPYDWFIYSSYD